MRTVLLAVVTVAATVTAAFAAEPSFHAGVVRLDLAGAIPLATEVWYPTAVGETAFQAGLWPRLAARDAPVAADHRFPVVLFSHGGGAGGGTPVVEGDLLAALARSGFIVVAPYHMPGAPRLPGRAGQVRRAFDAVLSDPRFSEAADRDRLGMVGFSLGGAVTLITAGAVPDPVRLARYCREHPEDEGACSGGNGGDGAAATPAAMRAPLSAGVLPLKAIVLMDPLAALFGPGELTAVRLPVLLYRSERNDLVRAEGNALALAAALPSPPDLRVVPGGHFIFIDPCPPAVAAEVPECRDPPGVEHDAVHRQLVQEITAFLGRQLGS